MEKQEFRFYRPNIEITAPTFKSAASVVNKIQQWRNNLRLEGVSDPREQQSSQSPESNVFVEPIAVTHPNPSGSDTEQLLRPDIVVPQDHHILVDAATISIINELLENPERTKAVKVRGFKVSDVAHIIRWGANSETRSHLDPPPPLPSSWIVDEPSTWNETGEDYAEAVNELTLYYKNLHSDPEKRKRQNPAREAKKITPLVAVNADNEPLGVATLRWKGDPYTPEGRIASIERVIVNPDPEYRRQGTGRLLFVKSIDYAMRHGYGGQGAEQVRAWVLTDELAGDFTKNMILMQKLGFNLVTSKDKDWSEYKRARDMNTVDNRHAIWYSITPNTWLRKLASELPNDKKIQECVKIPIELDVAA